MLAHHPLIVLLSLAANTATAQSPNPSEPSVLLEDYVVKQGDTCLGIARERFGNGKRIDILHMYNDLGPSPHRLRPGQILRLPAPATEGADAELTLVRNQVETFTPDRRPGSLHEKLLRGHKVGTAELSAAELTFVDTSRLQLSENTLIVVLGQARVAGVPTPRMETSLVNGTLRSNLALLAGVGPGSLVRTEGSEVELTAGESKVSLDNRKTTRLAVYRGRSKLRAAKKTVEVPEGFGSKAEIGAPPTPPRRLPAAPVWGQHLPESLSVAATAEIAASYQPGTGDDVPPPDAYHVQLARDQEFRDIITDARVPGSVLTLEAKGLTPGMYFARVAAIDADQFEGPWNDAEHTTVALQPPLPAPAPTPAPSAPVTPPAPPPPTGPRHIFGGVGMMVGGGLVTQNTVVGPRLGVEMEGSFQLTSKLALVAGARGAVEYYSGATTSDSSVTVKRRALSVGFALSLRYRLERARGLTPYLGALWEQLLVRLTYDGSEPTRDWFAAIGPIVGLALPMGPGAVFIEGGWRTPTTYRDGTHQDAPVAGMNVGGGYRLRF
jgi:hypothetical protein